MLSIYGFLTTFPRLARLTVEVIGCAVVVRTTNVGCFSIDSSLIDARQLDINGCIITIPDMPGSRLCFRNDSGQWRVSSKPSLASQLQPRWLYRLSPWENLQRRHRGLPVPIRFCAPQDHLKSLSLEEVIQATKCRLHGGLPTIWACTISWTPISCLTRRWSFRL